MPKKTPQILVTKITSKCFGLLLHSYVIRDLIQNMFKLTKLSFYLIHFSFFAVFLESFIQIVLFVCVMVLQVYRYSFLASYLIYNLYTR